MAESQTEYVQMPTATKKRTGVALQTVCMLHNCLTPRLSQSQFFLYDCRNAILTMT